MAPIDRDTEIIPFGLRSMLVQACLFAWIYPRLFDTSHDAWGTSALQFGGLFGVLAWSFATLPLQPRTG